MKLLPIYICILLLCVACFPEDKAVSPYDRSGLTTATIDIGANYSFQAFYSLKTHSVIRIEDYTYWDLTFDCDRDSLGVFLNSAQVMGVFKIAAPSFEQIPNDTSLFANNWRYDSPSGYIDSSAIGKWWERKTNDSILSKNEYFVTTLGVDANGNRLGVKKFTILNSASNHYRIRFANLDGTNDTTITFPKESEYNVVGVSMRTKQIIYPEPPKNTWDIHCTRYTQLFTIVEEFPYPVTGIFINKSKVKAYLDTIVDFRIMKQSSIVPLALSNRKDVIGYDWKTFDFTSAEFLVLPNKTYVISANQQYYKLFFSDFYDSKTGSKGVIQFQYQNIE